MEMVELEIEMGDKLAAVTGDLACRYFGDTSEASLAQVLELAFKMHSLWMHSVTMGGGETSEAVSAWQFSEPTVNRDKNTTVQDWLFRR